MCTKRRVVELLSGFLGVTTVYWLLSTGYCLLAINHY
jgi:hypothetical protein